MMKRLKFVALGLMLIMVQSALAVTLPTTSYNPYISGSYSSDVASYGSGVLVKGSYLALGSGSDADICRSDYPDTPPEGKGSSCENCCNEYVLAPCLDAGGTDEECGPRNNACVGGCEQGPSLPIDGGLSFLMLLALGSGVMSLRKSKK